jgi:hypothetical protein
MRLTAAILVFTGAVFTALVGCDERRADRDTTLEGRDPVATGGYDQDTNRDRTGTAFPNEDRTTNVGRDDRTAGNLGTDPSGTTGGIDNTGAGGSPEDRTGTPPGTTGDMDEDDDDSLGGTAGSAGTAGEQVAGADGGTAAGRDGGR